MKVIHSKQTKVTEVHTTEYNFFHFQIKQPQGEWVRGLNHT